MKVFLFFKDNTQDKEENEEQSNDKERCIEKVKISQNSSVKSLVISNPRRSSSLYIIHGLRLFYRSKVYKNLSKVSLYCNNYVKHSCEDDDSNNGNINDKGSEKLKVSLSTIEELNDKSMQLKDIKLDENYKSHVELLKNEFVIILPGGKFGVEFNNELNEIDGEIKIEKRTL